MFRRLHTKLTVVYAALFGLVMLMVAASVYAAVSGNAVRTVRKELQATGVVYDRIWALQARQLSDASDLLSRDFGFREAVATVDDATVSSALDNLRDRLGLDSALLLNLDGSVVGSGITQVDDAALDRLYAALEGGDRRVGVLTIAGRPYQVVASPIMAPVLTGWVVFAVELDQREMRSLEGLSPIPLRASIVDGTAHNAAGVRRVDAGGGQDLVLTKPLPTFGKGAGPALMLSYPMATAMQPYRPMLLAVVVVGLLGMGLLLIGSWAVARNLTRPISQLDDAVHRLQRGEDAVIEAPGQDEIGRLAASFNAMAADIRERQDRITHLALHDAETGLGNRLSIERWLAGDAPHSRGGKLYIAALGVDRFEHVRGAIGYRLASALLTELGARLARKRPRDAVALLSTGVLGLGFSARGDAEAYAIAESVLAELEHPVSLDGTTVDVVMTAGLASGVTGRGHVASPIERAAVAVEQARARRRKVDEFDTQAYGDPASALSLMSEMLAALKSGDIRLHHQPKYDLRAGAITGVEVLSRWTHPERGVIRPDLFVEMAEETGHIRPLTEWTLGQAIADQQRLRADGHDLLVSVNISGRLLSDAEFGRFAIAQVERSGARLCFEITETAVIDNPELALQMIDDFADAGICVSIDDYGSGLSSLSYLKRIRADELKIDKSFILALEHGARDSLLVKSTIDLAHSLGLKVTAEGVETPTALALLTAMGCDLVQGYLIAKPMDLDALVDMLDAGRPDLLRQTA